MTPSRAIQISARPSRPALDNRIAYMANAPSLRRDCVGNNPKFRPQCSARDSAAYRGEADLLKPNSLRRKPAGDKRRARLRKSGARAKKTRAMAVGGPLAESPVFDTA